MQNTRDVGNLAAQLLASSKDKILHSEEATIARGCLSRWGLDEEAVDDCMVEWALRYTKYALNAKFRKAYSRRIARSVYCLAIKKDRLCTCSLDQMKENGEEIIDLTSDPVHLLLDCRKGNRIIGRVARTASGLIRASAEGRFQQWPGLTVSQEDVRVLATMLVAPGETINQQVDWCAQECGLSVRETRRCLIRVRRVVQNLLDEYGKRNPELSHDVGAIQRYLKMTHAKGKS